MWSKLTSDHASWSLFCLAAWASCVTSDLQFVANVASVWGVWRLPLRLIAFFTHVEVLLQDNFLTRAFGTHARAQAIRTDPSNHN